MSRSQRAWKQRVLLGIALLWTACGTGISSDPGSVDRPHPGDERDADTADASISDARRDASVGDDISSSDTADARTEPLDRGADDSPDVARDVPSDVASDRSADAEPGRDVSGETTADRVADSSIDRDGAISDADGGDIDANGGDIDANGGDDSGSPGDVSRDSEEDVVAADAVDGCSSDCGLPGSDYYVDASAPPGGNGSKEAPFRTISAAIDAYVHAPAQARTAYVAEGTYDEALGEKFPLELRGLSLEGAGADKTYIVGSGILDHASQGGPKNQQYMVTMVTGDRSLPTKVSRLSMRPTIPVPAARYYGVFCDRGNATGEVTSPAGETHLDEISVGPNYDTGVFASPSTIPVVTGCNMLITRSTLSGGWTGVFALGCDGSSTPGPVILTMGTDDPASGNKVTWMRDQGQLGHGVLVGSCVVRASFQYNTISDCNNGLVLQEFAEGPTPGSLHPFTIKHNTFARMSNMGLSMFGFVIVIDELSDNRFLDMTRVPNTSERAIGLSMGAPLVKKVRRNLFAGNDIGIMFKEGTEQTNLGQPGDPGENVFLCNSGIDNWLGGDVVVQYPMQRGVRRFGAEDGGSDGAPDDGDSPDGGDDVDGDDGGSAPWAFAGNSWDHIPPRVDTSDVVVNGYEIILEWAPPLVFDLSGSSLVTTACPAGRIP